MSQAKCEQISLMFGQIYTKIGKIPAQKSWLDELYVPHSVGHTVHI